jgi:hypothetical protein
MFINFFEKLKGLQTGAESAPQKPPSSGKTVKEIAEKENKRLCRH